MTYIVLKAPLNSNQPTNRVNVESLFFLYRLTQQVVDITSARMRMTNTPKSVWSGSRDPF